MNSEIRIKKLDPVEIALAKDLILLFGFDSKNSSLPPDEYVRRMLRAENFHVIVALDKGKLIGGLTAYEMPMFKRKTTEMFLYEIEVETSYRRKGIGKALIEFLKDICREKDIIQIFVGTEKDNLPARRLYSATGGISDEDSVWFNYFFQKIQ